MTKDVTLESCNEHFFLHFSEALCFQIVHFSISPILVNAISEEILSNLVQTFT